MMWVHQSIRPRAIRGRDVTVIRNLREAGTDGVPEVGFFNGHGSVDEH
ncbi:hypothetical protein MSMEI_5808 [Mycolicibacterium smegmatis MC2 155]|uniref:Uncharacterized protein n=1 Tax=Mycolicibacterium smegmatis (strain ATCC 700084 / mc(2)155) TaxID=246196 RepID=I7GF79_MYCS2|nr:hypothetical protein MSMEI_5808 [Mycolicibacterium smegmatis MC2 155]